MLVLIAAACVHTFPMAMHRIVYPALFLQDFPGAPTIAINATWSPFGLFHFWSLAVEEHFYMVWPFVLLLPNTTKGALKLTLAVLLFCVVLFLSAAFIPFFANHLPLVLTRGGEIATGGVLALLLRTEYWPVVCRWAGISCLVGLAIFLAVAKTSMSYLVGAPSITVCFAGLLVLCLSNRIIEKLMHTGWLVSLGRISYGIYVYHVLLGYCLMSGARLVLGRSSGIEYEVLARVFLILGTFAASWVSYNTFERRFIQIGHARTARQPSAAILISE